MKKFLKVLIALVIIAAIAVGVYFIFFRKPDKRVIYSSIYDFENNIVRDDVNVMNVLDQTVENMIADINANSMQIDEINNYLNVFVKVKNYYYPLRQEILDNSYLIQELKTNNLRKKVENSFNKVKSTYLNCYDYLKGTYLAMKTANPSQAKVYIQNFYNLFKNMVEDYSAFFYSVGSSYLKALNTTMQKNKYYMLSIDYYINCVNGYANGTLEDKTAIEGILSTKDDAFTKNYVDEYFANKDIYDQIYSNLSKVNLPEVIKNISYGQIQTYINGLEAEEEQNIVSDYCTYIAKVEVV